MTARGRFLPVATTLFNRCRRLAHHPGKGLTSLLRANDSATIAPCFTAFLLPFRAPPPTPCIRHTSRTAGARHGNPLRFDFAWQRNARCISKCMGLISGFSARPAPLGGRVGVADDGLPSLGDVDVLDGHFLLALRPPASQNPSFLRECHYPKISTAVRVGIRIGFEIGTGSDGHSKSSDADPRN